MPLYPITAIALRLFGLWLIAQLVLALPGLIVIAARSPQWAGTPAALAWGLVAIALVAGLVCVVLVERLARTALRRAQTEEGTALSDSAQAFLLQAGGLFFVVEAVLGLPHALVMLASPQAALAPATADVAGQVLELVIGLSLIAAPVVWRRGFARLRGRR